MAQHCKDREVWSENCILEDVPDTLIGSIIFFPNSINRHDAWHSNGIRIHGYKALAMNEDM